MNFYWMQLVVGWIEPWMTPLARYLTKSRYLIALRDGFQLAMPLLLSVVFAFPYCIRLSCLIALTGWLLSGIICLPI